MVLLISAQTKLSNKVDENYGKLNKSYGTMLKLEEAVQHESNLKLTDFAQNGSD